MGDNLFKYMPGVTATQPSTGAPVVSPVGWTNRSTGIFYVGAGNEPTGTLVGFHYPFIGYLCGFRVSNTQRYSATNYTPPTTPYATDANTIMQMDLESDFLESNALTVGTNGTPTLRTASPPGSYTGYTEFFGNDWFDINVGAAEDLGVSFTVECWAQRKNTVDTKSKVFGYGPISTGEQDTTLRFLTDDRASFRFDNVAGPNPDVDLQMSAGDITKDNWHYFSISSYKVNTTHYYLFHVDGVYVVATKDL